MIPNSLLCTMVLSAMTYNHGFTALQSTVRASKTTQNAAAMHFARAQSKRTIFDCHITSRASPLRLTSDIVSHAV